MMRLWMAAVALAACGGSQESHEGHQGHEGHDMAKAEAPMQAEPLVREVKTQAGLYTVSFAAEPTTPGMGDLFSVSATVVDKYGNPVETGEVLLNARMPHHNHGMETDPLMDPGACDDDGDNCRHEGGVWKAEGFKLHMPGEWTVTIEVTGALGHDRTSFVYDMR